MSYILFFLFSALNLALFAVIHICHFRFLRPRLLTISVLIDGIIGIFLLVLLFNDVWHFELFTALICTFLLIIIYSILGPIMAERSLTIYLLFCAQPGDLSINEVEDKTNREYIRGNQMLQKRIREQVGVGSLMLKNNKISLTKKGRRMLWVYLTLRKLLKIEPKF